MSQSNQGHSYGPGCQLAQHVPTTTSKEDDMPPLKCQFFYSSRIGIDDPLSAVPVPGSTPVHHPPRPFSAYDNAALEHAWMGFSASGRRGDQDTTDVNASTGKNGDISTFGDIHPEQDEMAVKAAGMELERHAKGVSKEDFGYESAVSDRPKENFPRFVGRSLSNKNPADDFGSDSSRDMSMKSKDSNSPKEDTEHTENIKTSPQKATGNDLKGKIVRQSTRDDTGGNGISSDRLPISPGQFTQNSRTRAAALTEPDAPVRPDRLRKDNSSMKRSRSWSQKRQRHSLLSHEVDLTSGEPSSLPSYNYDNHDTTITGRPFLRLPSRRGGRLTTTQFDSSATELDFESEQENAEQENEEEESKGHTCKAHAKENVHIPVGVSRLHHVQLPLLQMKPIYWSPANDIAAVVRGTWFYAETMLPVEVGVANQLEMGYRELRVWSETWSDEIKSAVEVGAEGEERVAHQLWKQDDEQKSLKPKTSEHTLSTDPYCAAMCFNGEAAAEGVTHDPDSKEPVKAALRRYPNSQVIYADSRTAYILKPALQPSAYYGRRPLKLIVRGQTVGLKVIRGFNWKLWEKINPPPKKSSSAAKAEKNAPVGVDNSSSKPTGCRACKHEEERPSPSDVVFVIHGIGQKLSERMESFNFTHAINSFRRSMNLEMGHKEVQKVLRGDLGGIMVLPINWRTNLQFEEGNSKSSSTADHFTLDDITPKTIPAVRNMISDVMLDIPFYMSQHKPKMINAVIKEANRVYRIWCQNNPSFVEEGRVHLIAHSLGSAMAIDILSRQPTYVSDYNPSSNITNQKHFDFNTTNLFLCGSPAGFFLYLEKAMLTPRKGQAKAGAEAGDYQDMSLVSEVGTYGCVAVDNLYNIMAMHDPIAYQLNAAVDPQYATSLKSAQVPNATVGFFESFGNVVRSRKGSTISPAGMPAGIKRLPSQLEMDVHDFTREEIAERKFNLLNDNGQIDWFLSSGGGPLENQYINMLGAHSSYWDSQDFVRFIVTEVGRKPGKEHTLESMKAVKAGAFKVGQK